jgi:hypothetical protein
MRFLILTLYNGENEFDSCLRSVGSQSHADREQRVFENLPKAEAHTLLYETIMEVGDRYDLFLKLDADMVLANETVLERIAGIFRRVTNLDHLVLGVKDWYTDSDIIGVHTFSNRARWSPNPSGLFTDPDPEIPGRKVMIFRPRPIAVQHGTDPTPLQAFFFGVHRAMKACQVHVDGDLVLRNRLPASAVNRADPDLLAAFRNLENLDSSEVHSRLEARWRHWLPRQLRWLRAVGSDMRWLIVGQLIRDFLATPVRLARHFGRLRFSRLWTRMHS